MTDCGRCLPATEPRPQYMSCPACTVHCTHRTLYSTPARCRPVSRSPAAAVRRVRRAPRSCTPASAPPPVLTWRSLTLKSHATRDSDDIMMSCRPRIKHQTAVCRARPLQLQGPGGGVTRCRIVAAAAISPDPVWCSTALLHGTQLEMASFTSAGVPGCRGAMSASVSSCTRQLFLLQLLAGLGA